MNIEDLSADVGAADLSAIASNWPYLLLIGLVIIFIIALINAFYHPKNKDEKDRVN